jgi:hypothetical protein
MVLLFHETLLVVDNQSGTTNSIKPSQRRSFDSCRAEGCGARLLSMAADFGQAPDPSAVFFYRFMGFSAKRKDKIYDMYKCWGSLELVLGNKRDKGEGA